MIVLIIGLSMIGGALTIPVFLPFGRAFALLTAPFGGSLLAVAVALVIGRRQRNPARHERRTKSVI